MARGHFRTGKSQCFICGKRADETTITGYRHVYGATDTSLTHLCPACAPRETETTPDPETYMDAARWTRDEQHDDTR